MKKRFLAMLLALTVVLGVLPLSALAADSGFTIENGVLAKYNGPGGDVAVPEGVTEIGSWAFLDCTGLTDIQVSAGNQTHASIDGVLFSKDLKTLERYPAGRKGAYTIPDSVTEIGQQAFSGCTGLTNVAIPDSVTGIGDWAFSNCTGLTNVVIPGSVASIELCVFQYCTGLTSVMIQNGVADIGYSAFQGCTGLTSVTIPDSVISIGTFAFYGCNDLKDIYYSGTEAQWGAIKIDAFGSFRNDLRNTTIHYSSTGPDQPSNLPTVDDIPATGTVYARTQTVKLDGRDVEFQCYAVKNAQGDETNYVKLRDLAMALNGTKAQFDVTWDGQIGITPSTAYQAVGGEGTTPYAGDQPYKAVSDTPVSLNGSAVKLTSFSITCQGGGYTYYKLRDLGQLLGFNVKWDGGVVIETDKPYTGE